MFNLPERGALAGYKASPQISEEEEVSMFPVSDQGNIGCSCVRTGRGFSTGDWSVDFYRSGCPFQCSYSSVLLAI